MHLSAHAHSAGSPTERSGDGWKGLPKPGYQSPAICPMAAVTLNTLAPTFFFVQRSFFRLWAETEHNLLHPSLHLRLDLKTR